MTLENIIVVLTSWVMLDLVICVDLCLLSPLLLFTLFIL